MSDILAFMARRTLDDPFFLGSLLAEFARSEQLDDAALAAHLGCSFDTLTHLRLCRVPRVGPPGFDEDIAYLAHRFGLADEPLAKALHRGQILARFRAAPPSAHGFVAAAREADPPPPDPPED